MTTAVKTTLTTGPIYLQWYGADGRVLYLVSVPAFLRRYLPDVRPADGLARPPVPLSAFARSPAFLNPGERARVARFSGLKKQVEWCCGRLAAKSAAAEITGASLAPQDLELAYHDHGAPYFRIMPGLPVSISHAGDWAGAVAGGVGRVGLDIDRVPTGDLSFLLRAGFSRRERRRMVSSPPRDVISRWTLKEAYLKFIGQGFREPLAAVEIFDGRLHHHGRPVPGLGVIQTPCGPGHMMSLVFAA